MEQYPAQSKSLLYILLLLGLIINLRNWKHITNILLSLNILYIIIKLLYLSY